MSEPIRCFWTERTDRALLSLRRYTERGGCPNMPGEHGYHNVSVDIGDAPTVLSEGGYIASLSPKPYAGDARWPARCGCGYEFVADDHWQVNQDEYYRAEDGREWPHRRLPPGAMFDAWWMCNTEGRTSPAGDGIWLAAIVPPASETLADVWVVDGPASNNPNPIGWTRSGTVRGQNPTVTANPSILTPRYHGWLRNGFLVPA